jgi:hypothetical protein
MSSVKFLHGKNAKASNNYCVHVEDQQKVWQELQQIGKNLATNLKQQ